MAQVGTSAASAHRKGIAARWFDAVVSVFNAGGSAWIFTIIAGAMPPRVIATTARQPPSSGPCPSSRQASARLSRWIWSQLMWNPFSWGRRLGPLAMGMG